ncbi:MAG: IS1595 family transposase [Planctomycetes bacterium]|nr:IS1595 family transposase [Planctomycetota bacterium]
MATIGRLIRDERRRRPHQQGTVRPWTTKTAVMAMVKRGRDVRAQHIGKVTARNLRQQLSRHVDERSRLVTGKERKYRPPGARFKGGHDTAPHGIGEYVRGDVHTNTVEGFFALLKRDIYGTFHHVSKKHLQR